MIVTNGFEEMEAVGTFALLRRAGLEVDVFALSDTKATGRFGLTCAHLQPFSQLRPQTYAALIIPGGPQYKELEENNHVQTLIKTFVEGNKVVAAICAGPTLLGHAGYLKGKNYTCFTSMNEDFGGTYQDDYAITDGNIITAKSAAATLAFGFAIIERLLGKESCEKTKQEIYYKE
jgi:putative intracellular protease/amidase